MFNMTCFHVTRPSFHDYMWTVLFPCDSTFIPWLSLHSMIICGWFHDTRMFSLSCISILLGLHSMTIYEWFHDTSDSLGLSASQITTSRQCSFGLSTSQITTSRQSDGWDFIKCMYASGKIVLSNANSHPVYSNVGLLKLCLLVWLGHQHWKTLNKQFPHASSKPNSSC